jgi:hypothetical protein
MGASLILHWVVVEVFKKYHPGPTEGGIGEDDEEMERTVHNESSFWDNWKPCKFHTGFTYWRLHADCE